MKLDSGLHTQLVKLRRDHPPDLQDQLKVLQKQAIAAGAGVAFDMQVRDLFPTLFERGGRPLAPSAPSSFAATQGGVGVGRTVGHFKPTIDPPGVARFVDFTEVRKLAQGGGKCPEGLVILDTNLGADEAKGTGFKEATIDHHGGHAAGKGRGVNSTSQLLDRFDTVLRSIDVAAVKAQEPAKFTAALGAINSAANAHAPNMSAQEKEKAAAALVKLNLKQISSDNLGDGLSWPVWIARNQARVLVQPGLRDTIREATHFEDFGVFGSGYLQAVNKDVNKLSPGVKLQAALMLSYDEILREHGIVGSDRTDPTKAGQAEAVAAHCAAHIDALLEDPDRVEKRCSAFFHQVGWALTTVEEQTVDKQASIKNRDGSYAMPVFDVSKLADELGTFARWAVPPLFGEHALQMTVMPLAGGRSAPILAIPDERTLPSGKGLLSIVDELKALEKAKTPAGQPEAMWFGRDTVLLPSNPPGSVLSPSDIKEIVLKNRLLG